MLSKKLVYDLVSQLFISFSRNQEAGCSKPRVSRKPPHVGTSRDITAPIMNKADVTPVHEENEARVTYKGFTRLQPYCKHHFKKCTLAVRLDFSQLTCFCTMQNGFGTSWDFTCKTQESSEDISVNYPHVKMEVEITMTQNRILEPNSLQQNSCQKRLCQKKSMCKIEAVCV